MGNQWYWSYEYSDFLTQKGIPKDLVLDSFMVHEPNLNEGDLRQLTVDNS
jgi:cytochrome c oxidase subunit 2